MSNQSAQNVEVRVKIADAGAAAQAKKITNEVVQSTERVATATERAAARSAEATERSATRQRSSFQRLYAARDALGMRSEQAIQREIQRTEAAYRRLVDSGTLSWREQTRAAEAMRQKVAQLNGEMGRLTTAQKAMVALRGGASAVAGVTAAGYALRGPTGRAISFDDRLADMANTAYSERDTAGRRMGMKELEAAINRAVTQGGGTRDAAAGALDKLIASGVVSVQDSVKMLPQLMRYSTASGADAAELAQIALRTMQTFKIGAEDLPRVMNMAISAGQAGGFEMRDMARWLPEQMALAGNSGMSGRADFAGLLALNQAAAITAGNTEQAGNNVSNLLSKIFSQDAARNAQQLGYNLPKYLQQRRSQGVDSITAFGELVEKTVGDRADYKALQKQLANSKNDGERRATLESMSTIATGFGIGTMIQDRQAMMALLAMINNKEYMQKVLGTVRANDVTSGGAGDMNFDLKSTTTAYKLQQAEQQKEMAYKSSLDGLTPAIGRAAQMFSDLSAKFPVLTGTTILATGAITAMAGAAGLAAMTLGGGKAGGSAISRVGGWLSTPAAGRLARGVRTGGIAGVAATVGDYALEKGFGEDSAVSRYGSSALNGAALGATVGSIVPVIGTGIGAAAGGAIGLVYQGIKDYLASDEKKPAEVNGNFQIGLAPGLVLQSQQVQFNGFGTATVNTGNARTGAPG